MEAPNPPSPHSPTLPHPALPPDPESVNLIDLESSNSPEFEPESPTPSTNPTSPPQQQITAQDVLAHATTFLSTASQETLVATSIGLTAILYMIFGSLGLLLVGEVGFLGVRKG